MLYKSPAGLVLYWTMNNILSLVKNVFYKLKNPIKVLYISAATASAAGIICVVFGMKAQKMEIKAYASVPASKAGKYFAVFIMNSLSEKKSNFLLDFFKICVTI